MPNVPALSWHDLNQLIPVAAACFLLGAVETAAIGRMFVAKHGGRFDANRESLALVIASVKASLVLLYFMHLRYDSRVLTFLFVASAVSRYASTN